MRLNGISLEQMCRSYRWLHQESAWVEAVSLDPRYRPGREHLNWNKQNQTFPLTQYVQSEEDLLEFVRSQYGKNRMLCVGLNPRPHAFKNERGYFRGAREEEIEIGQSILFDFDHERGATAPDATREFSQFANEVDGYFADMGLAVPVRGYSGRGFHLLFAHPPIERHACPDLSARVARFAQDVREDFHKELAQQKLRLDRTHDLRRMVRLYGTAKPSVGIISEFYGNERVEDSALRDHLLSMRLDYEEKRYNGAGAVYGPSLIRVYDELPQVVGSLVRSDQKLRSLWHGEGKTTGDCSGSAYDLALGRRLMALGIHDNSVIATAIALRPGSSYVRGGKGECYLRRTIAKALMG